MHHRAIAPAGGDYRDRMRPEEQDQTDDQHQHGDILCLSCAWRRSICLPEVCLPEVLEFHIHWRQFMADTNPGLSSLRRLALALLALTIAAGAQAGGGFWV